MMRIQESEQSTSRWSDGNRPPSGRTGPFIALVLFVAIAGMGGLQYKGLMDERNQLVADAAVAEDELSAVKADLGETEERVEMYRSRTSQLSKELELAGRTIFFCQVASKKMVSAALAGTQHSIAGYLQAIRLTQQARTPLRDCHAYDVSRTFADA